MGNDACGATGAASPRIWKAVSVTPFQPQQRASFDANELAIVMSNYDVGAIESITEFPRGSRQSPKVGVVAERGKFLLKRRSTARAHPDRVRLAHRVQAHLAAHGFPIAPIIFTRDGRHTLVQQGSNVYELFGFVAGHAYEKTEAETHDAGEALARFHIAMETFTPPETQPIPVGDYHDAPAVRSGLCSIGSTLSSHDSFSGDEAELATLVQFPLSAYDAAAEAVEKETPPDSRETVIHADWHPGNLLFRKHRVLAVIDYDSVRASETVIDVGNGALQFSMLAGGDPATWPDEIDEKRYRAFLQGYASKSPLSQGQIRAIPHLMIEALISECVPPITQTGSVGQWTGFRVLQMVRRKVLWLQSNIERLAEIDVTAASNDPAQSS